ncbi:MAG: hypothetical protein HC908_17695 [Calothrix sp. SM1_7_51]|nr:hypothetical protein [Calothrix sp. SM1_7_51]
MDYHERSVFDHLTAQGIKLRYEQESMAMLELISSLKNIVDKILLLALISG